MAASDLPPRPPAIPDGPVAITGGAGFIGSNLAARLLAAGRRVVILDSFAREGVEENADWLRERFGDRLEVRAGDVRDRAAVQSALAGAAMVYHLAAQVAVTTSFTDPRTDFEVNALGTLNVLEELRRRSDPPPLVYTSTNKVYGSLAGVALAVRGRRYEPEFAPLRESGVNEQWPPDLHTPYGCSKGAADQYVLDYARSFGLRTVVFRMSCIYGPRQMGTEDQGWVAHLTRLAIEGRPITVYGDGMQVRDLLAVDDLVDALILAWAHARTAAGRAFNIGGGPGRTASLLEVLALLSELEERPLEVAFQPWRRGDQRYYVSDTKAFESLTGWSPRTSVRAGLASLHGWLSGRCTPIRVPGGPV